MKSEISMTEGRLYKKIWIFAVPLIFSGILQLLYNAFDLIVCGQFGTENSVAAISATNSLINLIVNVFLGLSIGVNVLMARCFGAQDKEKGQKVVYTGMIYSVIIGLIIGVFGVIFSKYFLKLMDTPSDIINLSNKYLIIYFMGVPFSMIYNFGSSILRATGDTKKPFIFLTIAGIVNVLLNLLLVIVFNLDVAGVAIATIVSQAISATLVVISMIKSKSFFEFKFKDIKFYKEEGIEILKIGLPAGIQSLIFSLSNVLIQSSINSLGTTVLNGNGASSSLEGFIYTAMNQSAHACIAFISANYGAKKYKNIPKIILYSISITMIMWFITASIVLLFKEPLLSLYLKKAPDSLEYGVKRITIILSTYFLCGLMDIFTYSLRGIGYSLVPTIISLCGACGFRIIWIFFVFPNKNFHSISGLAVSYPISWIITGLVQLSIFIILYKKLIKNKEKELILE